MGEFNATDKNTTNFVGLKQRFISYGFPKEWVDNFRVILWDIRNDHYRDSRNKFEDFADTKNLIHVSGLDPAILAFITGVEGQEKIPTTSAETFEMSMQQEVLDLLEV